MSNPTPGWKGALEGRIAPDVAREIDIFETQIELRKLGKLDEKVFAETRLRRGCYGQRYDNGQRNDGEKTQGLVYPQAPLTKGPSTMWDAPGMQRIKIPFGRVTAEQMEALAAVAEEYSDGILHVTTRQDFQLHFVHIEDTPTVMRRLAAVGITTREACGNTVRNVTACQYAGVCPDEAFDVTPYADAVTWFLLGHPDTQDFGRKFKVALSGCAQHACAVTNIHDLGVIAATRIASDGSGRIEHGFRAYVGGGLGSVPAAAQLFEEFLPESELLPVAQALSRVFARLGEKKNRARARLKFLVNKLGMVELKRLVREERAILPPDPRWTAFLDRPAGASGPAGRPPHSDEDLPSMDHPLHPPSTLVEGPRAEGFERWRRTNTRAQKQPGYVVATVRLPLGDLTSDQMRALASLSQRLCGDTVRTTIEQNLALRWVSEGDLPELHAELVAIGLGDGGAGTIADLVACPGTDTCKLGISSSRGLAGELMVHLGKKPQLPSAVEGLHIKASGCFNACGQHHLADIGFLGVSRTVRGRRVPHFQLVVGGQWQNNGGSYGLAIGAVPSKRVPELVDRLTDRFTVEKTDGEGFSAFVKRIGKADLRKLVEEMQEVPPYEVDPSFYSDWGDPREYTIGDMGVGECAGEVVSAVEFGLAASEREAFEAQLELDRGHAAPAARLAYRAMLSAARALVREQLQDIGDEADRIVSEFRARLVETRLFADPFAGDKFAHYFFKLHEDAAALDAITVERAHQRIEEASLFIEAAHACYDRMQSASKPS